jgi:hypothetical protein
MDRIKRDFFRKFRKQKLSMLSGAQQEALARLKFDHLPLDEWS